MMARQSRAISESGYYHIMLRGTGKRRLFEDDLDRRAFLRFASTATERYGVTVIAWCLMDNHVHLILLDQTHGLSGAMASLCTSYAKYVNERTGSVGHVFENRFKSKPIEDDSYLLVAVRYVHCNPAKAGICDAANYQWSSYHEYVSPNGCDKPLADTSYLLRMLGSTASFERLHVLDIDPSYEFEMRQRMNDEAAYNAARELLGAEELRSLAKRSREERRAPIRRLHEAGLSVRQIQRVTGVGKWSVEQALA